MPTYIIGVYERYIRKYEVTADNLLAAVVRVFDYDDIDNGNMGHEFEEQDWDAGLLIEGNDEYAKLAEQLCAMEMIAESVIADGYIPVIASIETVDPRLYKEPT